MSKQPTAVRQARLREAGFRSVKSRSGGVKWKGPGGSVALTTREAEGLIALHREATS